MKVFISVSETPEWWGKLTTDQKKAYIKKHPNSKFVKQLRSKAKARISEKNKTNIKTKVLSDIEKKLDLKLKAAIKKNGGKPLSAEQKAKLKEDLKKDLKKTTKANVGKALDSGKILKAKKKKRAIVNTVNKAHSTEELKSASEVYTKVASGKSSSKKKKSVLLKVLSTIAQTIAEIAGAGLKAKNRGVMGKAMAEGLLGQMNTKAMASTSKSEDIIELMTEDMINYMSSVSDQ